MLQLQEMLTSCERVNYTLLCSLSQHAGNGKYEREAGQNGAVDGVTQLAGVVVVLWYRQKGLQVIIAEVEGA